MVGVIPGESISRVDLLLGHATMLTADRWDAAAALVQEAMGIVLCLPAIDPSDAAVAVVGLDDWNALGCVEAALREVQSWDLALAVDHPDLARLRVVLSDARRELAAAPARRG